MNTIKKVLILVQKFIETYDINPTLVSFHKSGVIIMDTDKEDWRKHFIIPYGVDNKLFINKMTVIKNSKENDNINELATYDDSSDDNFKTNFNLKNMHNSNYELTLLTKLKNISSIKEISNLHKNETRSINITLSNGILNFNVNTLNSGETISYEIDKSFNKTRLLIKDINLSIPQEEIDYFYRNIDKLTKNGNVYIYFEKDKTKGLNKFILVQNSLSYINDCKVNHSN